MRPKSNIMTKQSSERSTTVDIKTITVEVKGGPKGHERSTSIEVEQFPDLPTALEFLGLLDGAGKITDDGKKYLFQIVTSEHRRNMERRARARLSGSPEERLGDLVKTDPKLRSRLNELLAEVDLPQIEA